MKKYVLTSGHEVLRYPLYDGDLLRAFNGKMPTIQEMVDSGIYVVFSATHGSDWTKNYIELNPVWDQDRWVQVWYEEDKTEEEISETVAMEWENVRTKRNILISRTDWTQLPDVPLTAEKRQQFQDYRKSLRDITEQTNPFEVSFPIEP